MKRRLAFVVAITVLVLASGYGISRRLSGPDLRIRVESTESTVERRGANGIWEPIEAGSRLRLDDEIRTAPGARAVINVGELATVRIAESSRLSVAEVTRQLSRVEVGTGRISARAHGGIESNLQVSVGGSDAIVETSEGAFSLATDGEGRVSVAGEEGRVRVQAANESVDVEAGQISVVEPDLAPSTPVEIPPSLFVKIGNAPKRLNTRATVVRGQTQPGSTVNVNGVVVRSNAQGDFSAQIELEEGTNDILIEVEDVMGRKESESLDVEVDTQAPDADTKVSWD